MTRTRVWFWREMAVRVGPPLRPRETVEGGESRALKYYHFFSAVFRNEKQHVDKLAPRKAKQRS